MRILSHKIEENRRRAVDAINMILDSEQSFIDTDHPSFWEHSFYLRGNGPKARVQDDKESSALVDGPKLPDEIRNVADGNKFSGMVKK